MDWLWLLLILVMLEGVICAIFGIKDIRSIKHCHSGSHPELCQARAGEVGIYFGMSGLLFGLAIVLFMGCLLVGAA